jgi:hypothetical protein
MKIHLCFMVCCDSIKIQIEHKFDGSFWNTIANCDCEVQIDKIVYLTEQSVDVLPPVLSSAERGGL